MGACLSCRFTTIGQSLVKFKLRTSSHSTYIADKIYLKMFMDRLSRMLSASFQRTFFAEIQM